jgi:hypothetical protein
LLHKEPVAVEAMSWSGGKRIIVGCGDMQIRGFDASGTCQWHCRYENGIPAQLKFIDIDGDGAPELIAGGEIISNQSTCRVLDPDGRMLAEVPMEGWTSRMTALSCAWVDGKSLAISGLTRDENLRCGTFPRSGTDAPLEYQEFFRARLGGGVTGVGWLTPERYVAACTAQGVPSAFDLSGKKLWSEILVAPACGLHCFEDGILVFLEGGSPVIFNAEGDEVGSLRELEGPGIPIELDGSLYLASGKRVVGVGTPS